MNWLTNFIRPRIRSIVGEQKDVPDNLWQKCESCDGMLFHKELKANLNVCYHCGHHLALDVKERLTLLFDDGVFERVFQERVDFGARVAAQQRFADRIADVAEAGGVELPACERQDFFVQRITHELLQEPWEAAA